MDEEPETVEHVGYLKNCNVLNVELDMESPDEAESLKQKCSEYVRHITETLLVCDDVITSECETKLMRTLSEIKSTAKQFSEVNVYDRKLQEDMQILENRLKGVRRKVEKFDMENNDKLQKYNKINELLCKAFGCTLRPIHSREGISSFELKFVIEGKLVDHAIRLDIDEEATVLDFDASSFCNELEQDTYKKWYHSTKNLAGLICKLRSHLQRSKQGAPK